MNLPSTASYSRAPTFVRPVASSMVPPTNPLSPGQAPSSGCVPRGLPYGSERRVVTVPVTASIASWPVSWWSEARNETLLSSVRTATV
jgi:hypothetical protein